MESKDTNIEYVNRIYRYMKNGANVEEFMVKFHINSAELNGLLELCRIYGKNVDIVVKNGIMVFDKPFSRNVITTKPNLDTKDLIHTELCVVSKMSI